MKILEIENIEFKIIKDQTLYYLSVILFIDLISLRFLFSCEKWFSAKHESGTLDLVIPEVRCDIEFQRRHLYEAGNAIVERHIVFGLFNRPGRSSFTRAQRLSICFAMLMLTMIANAMWYRTDDAMKENLIVVSFGPLQVTWHQLYSSTLSIIMVHPVIVFVMMVFQRTKKGIEKRPLKTMDTRSRLQRVLGVRLPRWFLIPAWFLILASIFTSGFFCILYSIEWGPDKANAWLGAFFLSFFQAVFLLDPLIVCDSTIVDIKISYLIRIKPWTIYSFKSTTFLSNLYELFAIQIALFSSFFDCPVRMRYF